MAHRVHEPGCSGYLECNGFFICRHCGKRTGWCRGVSFDLGFCPDCFTDIENTPPPTAEFEYVEGTFSNNERFHMQLERPGLHGLEDEYNHFMRGLP